MVREILTVLVLSTHTVTVHIKTTADKYIVEQRTL